MLAAYPVLYVYSQHLALVPLADVAITVLGLWLVMAVIVIVAAKLAGARAERVVAVAGGLAVYLFSYASFYYVIQQSPLAALAQTTTAIQVWWVFFGVLIGVLLWFLAGLKGAATFFNLASVALLLMSGLSIYQGLQGRRVPSASRDSGLLAGPRATGQKPDIIYIILDGYGRSDQLQRIFGIDNTPFLSELRNLGFYVADRSRTNYVQTQLSLTSSLNFDYVPNVVDTTQPDPYRESLNRAIDDSRLASFLKSQGYAYLAVGSGFPFFRFATADYAFVDAGDIPHLRPLLRDLTPWARTAETLIATGTKKRERIQRALANTQQLMRPTGKPRLLVVHMMVPHPPFVFNEDGSPREITTNPGLWDGSHFYDAGGTLEEYKDGYKAQLGYVDRRITDLLRRAVASNPNAIIVVQGDHGSKSGVHQEDWAKTDPEEVFGILNAYRVPEGIKRQLYPSISPVNSFRLILNGIFDAGLEQLPDRSFYSPWSKPYEFREAKPRS